MFDLFNLFSLFLLPVISLLITVGVWQGLMGQRSQALLK